MSENGTRQSCTAALSMCWGSLLASGGLAQAQSDTAADQVLEEIVVTAQRREESLRDVPISVSAFSDADLERYHIDDITKLINKSPNVSFTQAGIRSERDISIRGVSNIGGQVSALAFYVDEFNIVNGPRTANTGNINSSVNPLLQDIERIEVLRGPQGTFFGRNATGGAINITTKKPAPEFYAQAEGEYGRFDKYAISGVINSPIVSDRFLFRGSGYFEESDGFVDNAGPGGGGSDMEFSNVRLAGRILPSDRLTVDLSLNYAKEEHGISEEVATGVLNASSANLLSLVVGPNPEAISDGLSFYPDNRSSVSHDLASDQEGEFITAIARVEYATDAFSITSVTGYFDSEFDSINDLDFTSNGWLEQRRDVTSESVSQELRVASIGQSKLEWTAGVIYAEDELRQQFSVVPGPDGFVGLPQGFRIDTGDITFETESFALFGDLTWNLSDRLAVSAGGRFTRDDVSQVVAGITFETPDVPGSGQDEFDDFSPRVSLIYDWSDQLTTYATISKGYKAGGLQLNVTQQLPVFKFDEETLWNYEIGARLSLLGDRMRINSAVFYMDWEDLQVSTNVALVDPETQQITFVNTTSNAASATSQGFELDIRALPLPGLELGAGVGYLDAEFDDFREAIVQGEVVDLSKRPIPRAPEWTLNADAGYRFPILDGGAELFALAEWSYRSETFPDVDSLLEDVFPFRAPSFDVWNFRAGFENERFRVAAFLENAFDEEYFTRTDGFSFAGIRLHPSQRVWGVTFTARTR